MNEAREQERAAGTSGAENPQRDGQGRFAAGNRGGPGNPFARQTAALRKALVNAVTEKDIEEIVQALLAKAKQGDTAASRLILSYTLGKPAPVQDPDTLDQKELAILAGNHVDGGELQRIASLFPVDLVLEIVRVILPYLGMAKAQQVQDLFEGKAAAGSGDPRREQAMREGQEVDPCRIFDEEKDEDEEEEDDEEVQGAGSDLGRAGNDKPPSSGAEGDRELAAALAGFDRETERLKAILGIPQEEIEKPGNQGREKGEMAERRTDWEELSRPKANGDSNGQQTDIL